MTASSWQPIVRKNMMGADPCMRMAGIFDHHGNKLATSSCFLPPSSEIASLIKIISSQSDPRTVELEGVKYAVQSNSGNVLRMKARHGLPKTFSCCVVLCPSVLVLGISDDAVTAGKGVDVVTGMAKYITDSTTKHTAM